MDNKRDQTAIRVAPETHQRLTDLKQQCQEVTPPGIDYTYAGVIEELLALAGDQVVPTVAARYQDRRTEATG